MRQRMFSPYEMAQSYLGVHEVAGEKHHPLIVAWLSLVRIDGGDEIPWCAAFAHGMFKPFGIKCSGSALARSFLGVGEPVAPEKAEAGFDVVIMQRGDGPQPGPENRAAPGHVFLFGDLKRDGSISGIGGNQSNAVTVGLFALERVLGIRRLA